MARVHLFEFNDQPWLPAVLRDAQTGYLEAVSRRLCLHESLVAPVARALCSSRADRIVDLCSGSGGPIVEVRALLPGRPPVVLTDRYPNRTLCAAPPRDGVTALAESIDAAAVPERLTGLRTVINALHHFRPADARRVLADAVSRGAPILVIELSARTWLNVLTSPLIVPAVLVFVPFIRPLRWQYVLFTYLLPVIPLILFWDGLVSHLRSYTPDEMRGLAAEAGDDYEWEAEQVRVTGGIRATTLFGRRRPDDRE